jgi:tRNA G18 (ribose-2'-O)-methylase SpoU
LDPHDPRIAAYRSLKGKALEREGIFIAEGEKVVRSLIDSRHRIESCLISRETRSRYKPLVALMAKRGARVYVESNRSIEDIIGFRFHKGIMAVGHCPEKLKLSEALKEVEPHRAKVRGSLPPDTSAGGIRSPAIFVALDSINDPQNVGLIARSARAFGAAALIVDGSSYDPYYRKAIRVSMGTIFSLPVYYEDDLRKTLLWLGKKHNTRIVAATPGRGSIDIARAKLSGNICLVLGNEDKGVSAKILNIADVKVRIPISKSVDSLNVASACAICLYEVEKSQKKVESGPTAIRR